MMRRFALTLALVSMPVLAYAQTTGSVGCAAITQAAADGISARVQADDASIRPPNSVKNLSCLDGFFRGVGLNVISNLLDPTSLLDAVQGQICAAANQAWQSALGSAQCGLTVSGFNLGFGGFGGGVMCPRLSFGGGGPPIGSVGTGANTTGSLYVNGSPLAPTGYTLPSAGR
ncbi:hypothetical protein [Roseomonas populi]|uniref:Uncharacterized protein n=1 Tax=Roseomonas populi TaxID=3121582 RepID=A0ABT1X7M6_9PROT|nr:hypothetical protein [Roseomonas pecuniae]MCR0984111.1 hypothetical protein [Roseomonas pecuniae]